MIILAQLGVKGITANPIEDIEQEKEKILEEIYLPQEVEFQRFKERLGHEELQYKQMQPDLMHSINHDPSRYVL